MKNKVKIIMASVFEIPASDINDDSSPDSIENWDSLRHMNLITVLEQEFDIRFNDDQIIEMLNFEQVIHTTNKVLNDK